jgi:hypothetical protein
MPFKFIGEQGHSQQSPGMEFWLKKLTVLFPLICFSGVKLFLPRKHSRLIRILRRDSAWYNLRVRLLVDFDLAQTRFTGPRRNSFLTLPLKNSIMQRKAMRGLTAIVNQ